MGSSHSRSFKALILAFGKVLSSLIDIAIAAVLTRVFLKAEYATYRQTFLAFNLVAPLLTLGIPMAIYYFVPKRKDASRGVMLENVIILTAAASLFAAFMFFGGGKLLAWRFSNEDLTHTLIFLIPFAYFELISRSVTPCLMAHDRPKQVTIFNIVTRLILFVFAVSAALIFGTTMAVVIGAVLASALRCLIGVRLMWSATANTVSSPAWSGCKEQLKYGIPLGLSGAIATLNIMMDKFIVASICDPDTFAVYTVGAFQLPFTAILTGSITAVLLADLSTLHTEKKLDEGVQIWGRAAVKVALIMIPMMVCFFVFAPYIITVLFSEKYSESAVPFRIYLLAIPIKIVNYGSMIMAAGASKMILLRTVISLSLNIGLSILLTINIGAIGAAIATIMVMFLFTVPFNLLTISRLWNTSIFKVLPWKKLGVVFLMSILPSAIFLLGDLCAQELRFVVLCILFPIYAGLVVGLFIYFRFLERDFPKKVWQRIRGQKD